MRLMSKIYYYRLLALGSTHVKFDVWRGTKKLQIIRDQEQQQILDKLF